MEMELEQSRCPWHSRLEPKVRHGGDEANMSQSSECKRTEAEKNLHVLLFSWFPEDPLMLVGEEAVGSRIISTKQAWPLAIWRWSPAGYQEAPTPTPKHQSFFPLAESIAPVKMQIPGEEPCQTFPSFIYHCLKRSTIHPS